MIAIIVKSLPATNTKPQRWKAVAGDGRSITVSDYNDDSKTPSYARAAIALCHKMGWVGKLVHGQIWNSSHVFVFSEGAAFEIGSETHQNSAQGTIEA